MGWHHMEPEVRVDTLPPRWVSVGEAGRMNNRNDRAHKWREQLTMRVAIGESAVPTMPKGGVVKHLFVLIVVLSSLAVVGAGVAAQEATPTAAPPPEGLIVPDPADCQAEPRPISDFEQIVATPPAMSMEEAAARFSDPSKGPLDWTMPEGEPADADTVAAAMAVLDETLACLNANSSLQFLAMFTDEMLDAFFVLEPLPPEALQFFAATPEPSSPELWLGYLSLHDVLILPDGRVAALVESYDPTEPPYGMGTDYVILKQVGDQWLIDTLIENVVVEGMATPAG
jgi:hypothetical protein